jgi:hypothetical protein
MEDSETEFLTGPLEASSPEALADAVFDAKARRRKWLASLPVEEKYRRFLRLQRMVYETRRAAGKPCPPPWPDTGEIAPALEV